MNTSRFAIGAALLLALLLAVYPVRAQDDTLSSFEIVDCWYDLPDNVTCGYLTVPEDHTNPDNATIRLAVAIIHTTNPDPLLDPVLFLQGGPGLGSITPGMDSMPFNREVLARRDMIFLDQRGTGLSEPNLGCPEYDVSNDDTALDNCRDELEAQNIQLAAYTSAQSAADVEHLRTALHYDTWNLYGISYGTRLALTVLRDYPAGVRSVILDSVYPPQVNLFTDLPVGFSSAAHRLFDNCAADLLCGLLYPNLEHIYYDLFNSINAQPVPLDLMQPDTGETLVHMLTGDDLRAGLFQTMYDANGVRWLPAVLYNAYNGDFSDVTRLAQAFLRPPVDALSHGMYFSVQCGDEAGHVTTESIRAAKHDEQPALQTTGLLLERFDQCTRWPAAAPDPREEEPVRSDVPVLLLAGEYDPATPPQWAAATAEYLSNSFVYTFPGFGHGVLAGGRCPVSMAIAFLDNPDAAPDSRCIAEIGRQQFVVTTAATRVYAHVLLLLTAAVTAWGTGWAGLALRRRTHALALRFSLRAVGWMGLAASTGAVVLFLLADAPDSGVPWGDRARVIETLIPLVIGLQAALLFAPDDEPALEVQLACPRPIAWAMLERLALLLALQGGVALAGTALSLALVDGLDAGLALARWIPPALFFGGLGAYVTLRSRTAAFGAAVTGIVWFAFAFFANNFVPGAPIMWPLNYIQPFLWPLHPFLQPDMLATADYWLNRVSVFGTGIGLMLLTTRKLHDEEWVLLARRSLKSGKGKL